MMQLLTLANLLLNTLVACISIIGTLLAVQAYLRKRNVYLSPSEQAYYTFCKEDIEKHIPAKKGAVIIRVKGDLMGGTISIRNLDDGVLQARQLHVGPQVCNDSKFYIAVGYLYPGVYRFRYINAKGEASSRLVAERSVSVGRIVHINLTI